MSKRPERPDVERIRSRLKDFQRRSVDYVVRRLYDDADRVDRFLLADEVGLGKTMVAKGVVAHAIDRLWEKVDRIDIVYVCSNATIARQNVDRLRLDRDDEFASPSRMTLLPLHVRDLASQKVNFVSFTPATSFDLGSSTGIKHERMLLYYLLKDAWSLKGTASSNLLRGDVRSPRWREDLDEFGREIKRGETNVDDRLAQSFVEALAREEGLRPAFEALCSEFTYDRQSWPDELRQRRNELIGRLRRVLARTCIQALEPDVVILDEFQRFKTLLAGEAAPEEEREVAELANDLFQFRTTAGDRAKVLLLSATPYKMYTLAHEEEDHYADFLATARFLFDLEGEAKALEKDLYLYRDALCADRWGELGAVKERVEGRLRRVMCRTERLAMSVDRNGMIAEQVSRAATISSADVAAYRGIDAVARAVEAGDCVELWKSAPYLLNLMDDHYQLKRSVVDGIEEEDEDVGAALRMAKGSLLDGTKIEAFHEVDPGNARLRSLLDVTVRNGAWKLLWIPPAMPYYSLAGPFADEGVRSFTKTLVFSSWHVVPKAIAALVSYEAERLQVRAADPDVGYRDLKRFSGPLRFADADGRLTGMPVLTLLYPCAALAARVDPLAIGAQLASEGRPASRDAIVSEARAIVVGLLAPEIANARRDGPVDESWYWASLVLLDSRLEPDAREWFVEGHDEHGWYQDDEEGEEGNTLFDRHLDRARELLEKKEALGPPPPDLAEVVTLAALGSPAIAILRALGRQWPGRLASPQLLSAAAWGALGFRAMYNRAETVTLLRGLDGREPYWERALAYGVDGCIQAMVDEYVHALRDHMSLQGQGPEAAVEIGDAIQAAVSLAAVRLSFDHFEVPAAGPVTRTPRSIRARYALRFGQGRDIGDDDGKETRDDQVRDAFNSPFRPFVLASTSVGQEGLDFHLYCHRIVHWNLPSNPVDLEQREGRIHRFKGHVVRKNLAAAGLRIRGDGADPWASLYDEAAAGRGDRSDMVPFWVCDGEHRIERHVPMLPLSREEGNFVDLKRSMALYRLVFGQPRQEDLLRLIAERGQTEELAGLRIDLSPRTAQ
jgi:hypothetical protein